MTAQIQTSVKPARRVPLSFTPARGAVLRRQCACGGTPGPDGECEECRKKRLQRKCASGGMIGSNGQHGSCRNQAETPVPAMGRYGHTFAQVRVSPASHGVESRNPNGKAAGGVTTVGPDAGSAPASPSTPGAATPAADTPGAAAPGAAAPVAPPREHCSVVSGPEYNKKGIIPVNILFGRKNAYFTFDATFAGDGADGSCPRCCEIRQFIKWDSVFHNGAGGPPHEGFPSSTGPETWIEDRDAEDKRYGHRTGPHKHLVSNCHNTYKTRKTVDQANGNYYCGNDSVSGKALPSTPSSSPSTGVPPVPAPPGAPPTPAPATAPGANDSGQIVGQYQFRLDAVDTCNGEATKASSEVITINW